MGLGPFAAAYNNSDKPANPLGGKSKCVVRSGSRGGTENSESTMQKSLIVRVLMRCDAEARGLEAKRAGVLWSTCPTPMLVSPFAAAQVTMISQHILLVPLQPDGPAYTEPIRPNSHAGASKPICGGGQQQ